MAKHKRNVSTTFTKLEKDDSKIMNSKIETLTDDCLLLIFEYLPILDRIKIERVCKRWQKLSKLSWSNFKRLDFQPKTWTSKCFTMTERFSIERPLFNKVLKLSGKYITSVDFTQPSKNKIYHNLGREGVRKVLSKCPNIRDLQLLEIKFKKRNLMCIGRENQRRCNPKIHNLSSWLKPYCEKITKLGLNLRLFCDNKNEITELFKKMKNIKSLHLSGFRDLLEDNCLLECLPFVEIEEITFSFTVIPMAEFDLLNALIGKFVNLRSIHINVVPNFKILLETLHRHTNLITLKLPETQIEGPIEGIRLIMTHLVYLETLDVSGLSCIDDIFLKVMAKNCKELRELNISNCKQVTDVGICSISSLKKLRRISMINLNNVVCPLLETMPNLEKLDCSWCKSLGDTFIKTLADNCKNLKELELSSCLEITNVGISNLSSLKKLRFLSIAHLKKVTVLPLRAANELEELNCSYCDSFSLKCLHKIIQKAPRFRVLHTVLYTEKSHNELLNIVAETVKKCDDNRVMKLYLMPTVYLVTKIDIKKIKGDILDIYLDD